MRPRFGKVYRFNGDAGSLEDALGEANGVEGRGARADGADAQILRPFTMRQTAENTPDRP